MAGVAQRYAPPAGDKDFEHLCLLLLRKHWDRPELQLYGRRGQEQNGVDIVDTSGSSNFRAAQCKNHDPLTALPPGEVQAEVDKALKFRPKLKAYLILTTAKSSTEAQQKVIQLNRKHAAKKLFRVELKCWEDICLLIDQYAEVFENFISGGVIGKISAVGAAVTTIGTDVSSIRSTLEDLVAFGKTNRFDEEIELAKKSLEKRDHVVAKHRLITLQQRHWDGLTANQKFRTLSNLAVALMQEGSFKEAGETFITAKPFAAEDEKAIANEVKGYFLAGRTDAFKRAEEALIKFPANNIILSIWLNCAPGNLTFEELEARVPAASLKDPEVLCGLARRATLSDCHDRAIQLATSAAEVNPEWSVSYLLRAEARVRRHVSEFTRIDPELLDSTTRNEMEAAEVDLSAAISKALEEKNYPLAAEAFVERSVLRNYFNNIRGADEDVEEAYRLNREDVTVRRHYADLLKSRGQLDRAIEVLRTLEEETSREDIQFILGAFLRERNVDEDIRHAAELFVNVALNSQVLSDGMRQDAAGLAVRSYCDFASFSSANSFITSVAPLLIPAFVDVLWARVALSRQNTGEAAELARCAVAKVTAETNVDAVRSVASLLSEVGLHREALPLWRTVVSATPHSLSCRRLIDCAARLGEHGIAIETLRQLRVAGLGDSNLLHAEIDLLEQYDLESCIQLLREYVSNKPSEKLMRLRLSYLGVIHDRPELVSGALSDMPLPSEITPLYGKAATLVLKAAGHGIDAARYGYELLHYHFEDPDAHRAFMLVLHPISGKVELPAPTSVAPGCAVCYLEQDDSQERWVVIEDDLKPDQKLDEIGISHELAIALLGKSVGEEFEWAKTSIKSRIGIVKHILNKFVFRYQQCLQEWELRFPEERDLQMVKIGTEESGNLDLTQIVKSLEQRQDSVRALDDLYRNSLMPLHMIAEALGGTVWDSLAYFVNVEQPFVRCCDGTDADRKAAFEAISSAKLVVLDLSALTTLAMTSNIDILSLFGVNFVVSQHTRAVLTGLLKDARGFWGTPAGTMSLRGKQIAMLQDTDETRQLRTQKLQELIARIDATVTVLPCPALASIRPELRETIIKAFGRYGAESILLAREPGHILWTDDYVQARIASTEFGVKRCWTQIALESQVLIGTVSSVVFGEISAKLAGAGYYFTGLSSEIILAGAELAEWQLNRSPLNHILNSLGTQSVPSQYAFTLSARFILEIFRHNRIPEKQTALLVKVLEVLAERPDGRLGVLGIQRVLPDLFGLNVVDLASALRIFDFWIKQKLETDKASIATPRLWPSFQG
jgi:tetratricopeptide (TPR) repeat protein